MKFDLILASSREKGLLFLHLVHYFQPWNNFFNKFLVIQSAWLNSKRILHKFSISFDLIHSVRNFYTIFSHFTIIQSFSNNSFRSQVFSTPWQLILTLKTLTSFPVNLQSSRPVLMLRTLEKQFQSVSSHSGLVLLHHFQSDFSH